MQLMYVMAFLVTLIIMISTQGRDTAQMVSDDSRAVAEHMAMWHSAAIKHCVETVCSGGIVNPTPKLPPLVRAGPAFAGGNYVARYDNMNNRMVTYMASEGANRGTATFGRVASALQDLTGRLGETSHSGIWSRAAGRVNFGKSPIAPSAPTYVSLPSPFMGGTIPDGSPVLVGVVR